MNLTYAEVVATLWMMMTMDHCFHSRHGVEAYTTSNPFRTTKTSALSNIYHSRNNAGGPTNRLLPLLKDHGRKSPTTPRVSLLQLLGQNSNDDEKLPEGGDQHKTNNDDDDDGDDWSLQQDWALLDNVGKFTVESGAGVFSSTTNNNYDNGHGSSIRGECRTFWMQLGTSIPILSRKTPEELYERCQELVYEASAAAASSSTSKKKNGKKDIKFGPSPPLLQHWQLLDNDESSCNQAVGQLSHTGQTIWIKYHCLGRLANDPFFSDMSTSATSSMSVFNLYSTLGGGYIETIDGRIYELGIPSPRQAFSNNNDNNSENQTKRKKQSKKLHYQSETYLKASNPYSAFYNEDEDENMDHTSITFKTLDSLFKNNEGDPWPWMPATTATMSALLASTVLSACIGYGAGLGIIADGNYHSNPSPSTQSPSSSLMPSRTSMLTTRAADASSQQQQALKPSIEELKARSEYRILREQRMIQNLEYKMAQEQKALQNLNQMIMMDQQQNPNLGGPSSSSLLP